ncbi:amino acid ABC transporter substrate-binding protein [Sphaerisporangium rufum]|uniref:Amino acid ABC transporter substrate-binding protein n=2 Tax=Sphaerisporangium rufum TaxID=1381558 RepID=A0A919R065_9ACTN|nr:amino acid ABC transporter substrate-binding protein [Sphaerisporangium rufum]
MLAVATTAAVALTAACGGRSDSADASGDSDIPIALVYPTSGVWKTQGENSLRGAQLAINDINAAGGVLGGRKLVAKVADAGNDPQTAASAARQLLQRDKVAGLLGAYLSSYTLTVSTVAERAGVADVTQSFSDELVTRGYKNTFKTTPTAKAFSTSVFDYLVGMYEAAGKKPPSAAILASDDASGQQQYAAAVEAAPKANFDVVLKVQYPANITDTNALVNRIAAAKPEILLLNGPDLAEIQIVKAIRARGIDVPVVGLGGAGVTTQAFVDSLGAGVDGVLATVPFNGDITPRAADVAKRYNAQHSGTFMPAESGTAYVGAWLIAKAIDKAGSADAKKVADALRTLNISDGPAELYPGGAVRFNATGLNESAYPLMIQYQGGKPVTVWPEKDAKAKPKL